MNNLMFADLIDINSLQMLQDSFSAYTGMAFSVIDTKGNYVTKSSGSTEFCGRLTKRSEKGAARCRECDSKGIIRACEEGGAVFYTCHAGLTRFVIPIKFEGRVIGNIIAGQVRSDDIDIEKVRQQAVEMDIDPDKYAEAILKTNYISKEQAQKTADFLSEFSEALSIMAFNNFQKLDKSRKMERKAVSQSSFLTDLTEDLNVSMREWLDDFRETTSKYEGIDEITNETDSLLAKGQEVYAVIGGAVDYIRMSGGNVEFSESIYDIRKLINKNVTALKDSAEKAGVNITVNFDDSLPEKLAGNSGRIGQVLSKLCGNVVKFTREGGELIISVSCSKTTYSCNLIIGLTVVGTLADVDDIDKSQMIIKSGGSNIFGYSERTDNKSYDFPLVIMLVKQMSGKLRLEGADSESITFTLTIPQLDGTKTSA